MGLAGANDVVAGILLLEHAPHDFDILGRVAPIPFRVEIPKEEFVLFTGLDCRDGLGDLSGDKSFASSWALMVEENAVTGPKAIALSIVNGHPIGVDFGGGVGASGTEGGFFVLRRRRATEHLRTRRLVETSLDTAATDCLEKTSGADRCDITSVLRHIEADPDMGLGTEVVDLIGRNLIDEGCQLFRIGQIAVMEEEPDIRAVWIFVDMVYSACVETAGPPDKPMDFIAF